VLLLLLAGAFITHQPSPAVARHVFTGARILPRTQVATALASVLAPSAPQTASIAAKSTRAESALLGRPLHSVVTNRPEVALTFDDGPSRGTEPILKILKREHAYATFFFCGRTLRGPGWRYASDAAAAGHDIGNHTTHHRAFTRLSAERMAKEVTANQERLARVVGYEPRFVRPRAGVYDAAALESLRKERLVLALWSVTAGDADGSATVESITRNATTGVRPGSIILLHETNPDTVKALPGILAELKRKGLAPVTLSMLLANAEADTRARAGTNTNTNAEVDTAAHAGANAPR
jgi:peptidoglycan/xylan/chitin deacetylase (PgdA/CDA1 family)